MCTWLWLWQSFAVERLASCPQGVGSSLERPNARARIKSSAIVKVMGAQGHSPLVTGHVRAVDTANATGNPRLTLCGQTSFGQVK